MRSALPSSHRLRAPVALFALTSLGCGMGSDPQAHVSALVTSALPRCDATLLHPRITVGATTHLPGKLIVYVDGVMACVDDAARVDQLVGQVGQISQISQIDGRGGGLEDHRLSPRRSP
ncbi:MAG: hypothetical protein RMK29_09045 [Myxococcales bacterium]|nr:hypothetical protein [Myxococcota bacterium]MDW8281844.1 hypothetical protein [Myxococcales bacterium]